MAEDQRSKLIFDALGDTHISLDDGLSILDAVRKDESPELTMEAIDKLLCRYPSSPLIFARKLEAGRSVEEQIKSIKSSFVSLLNDVFSMFSFHCLFWIEIFDEKS